MKEELVTKAAGEEATVPCAPAMPTFAEAVGELQGMVFSIALHFLRDRALAEELSQDVFLQLYEHFGEIKSMEHLKHWLRRVTSHRCIDSTRRRRHETRITLDQIPEPGALTHASDPMLSERLRRLVAALPEKQRIVVILRYQEELMPEEIAAVLRMPPRKVKRHLQQALQTLRDKTARSLGEVSL